MKDIDLVRPAAFQRTSNGRFRPRRRGIYATMQLLRFRVARRAPGGWGWMSRRPVPREVMDGWFRPARTSAGSAGTSCVRYGHSIPDRRTLLRWAEEMRSYHGPVLVVWATEDRLMPATTGDGWPNYSPTRNWSRSRTPTH
jgi:hypothetical protein